MKIVILDGIFLNDHDFLKEKISELGEVTYYDRTPLDKGEIISRLKEAQVVLTNKVPLEKEVLEKLPKLKYIGITATGYNIIDLDYCQKNNITVTNVPEYSTEAVAQFTFALLLEITSKVGRHNRLVHEGRWSETPDFTFWEVPLMELKGKKMGLLGFGMIGKEVAKIAQAFSMEVYFYNHRKKTAPKGVTQLPLDELLQISDIVSLHLPLFPETEKIINEKSLGQMKTGSILINTARGPLVDEKAVCKALETGKLAAFATDVVTTEPIKKDNPLLQAKNCLITPHIAWSPLETRQRLVEIAAENLRAYEKGEKKNRL